MSTRFVGRVMLFAGAIASMAAHGDLQAATHFVDLYVRPGVLTTVDGRSLPALCYALTPSGQAELPAPIVTVASGDQLDITLHNQDSEPHGLEVVGLGGGTPVPAGGTGNFVFTFPSPGTWLYRDPVDYPVHQGLGLSGAIEVTDAGAGFAGEFLWLLNEHNEHWMTAHQQGQPVDTSTYWPDYFTVNGRSGLDTNDDPRAHITGTVGDELLIRVVNGGLRMHSLHFHGYHVDVVARDGEPLDAPLDKDTIAIPVGGTAEFILRPHQPGVFPIHDHVVISVTANGVYPLGMIVFTDIQS